MIFKNFKFLIFTFLSLSFVAGVSAQCPGPAQRTALINLQKANVVETSRAGQIPLTDTCGNQRYAEYVEINFANIAYIPAATGNTLNLSEFVFDPNDDLWYIDWQGNATQFQQGGTCDQDWLEITTNTCPDNINDSIYKQKYVAIGARLVWPTAELLVSDSSAVQVTVLSGNRNTRLGFYDNFNQTYSTIDQAGNSTVWYIEPAGEMRWVTAGGGTVQAPGAPFVNQFALNPADSPLPTVQAHLYPNTRIDTFTVRNFLYSDINGKFRSRPIDSLIQIVVDSIGGDTTLQANWYTTNGVTSNLLRTAVVKRSAWWRGVDSIGFMRFSMRPDNFDGSQFTLYQDSVVVDADTVVWRSSWHPELQVQDLTAEGTYFHADSLKVVGIGQFPDFPNLRSNGTDKGFYYHPSDEAVGVLNGDGAEGTYSQWNAGPNYVSGFVAGDAGNTQIGYNISYTSIGNSGNHSQNIATNDGTHGVAQAFLESGNPANASNMWGVSHSAKDTNLTISTYLGESSVSNTIYEGRRAWGVSALVVEGGNTTAFHWLQSYLPNDTIENAVSFYNRAYYWKNEHPIGAAGDTLVHFWAATGPGGEAGKDPGFITLDDIRGDDINIYQDDGLLKAGGTTVGLDSGSLKFNLRTTAAATVYGIEMLGNTATTTNRYLSMRTASDSMRLQEFVGEHYLISSSSFQFNFSDQFRALADSAQWIEGTVETKGTQRFLLGMTPGGWMKRFDGNDATSGQALISNGTDWVVSSISSFSLVNWTESFSSATQATSAFTATNAATNVNAAIVPKGTGALTAAMPDGTTVGGNSRGANATDLQTSRNNAAQVASGTRSTIGGGRRNTASGEETVIGGGDTNTASGAESTIGGGTTNTASGVRSTIGGGDTNTASGNFSTVDGGIYGIASLYGQRARAGERFAATGDAQTSDVRMQRTQTGTGQVELFLDGGTIQAVLPATNRAWNFSVQITGVCSAAGNGVGITTGDVWTSWHVGGIKRLNTTTSLVGTVQAPATAQSNTGMATTVVTIDADDSTEALRIRITPPTTAGTTTASRWIATVHLTEAAY